MKKLQPVIALPNGDIETLKEAKNWYIECCKFFGKGFHVDNSADDYAELPCSANNFDIWQDQAQGQFHRANESAAEFCLEQPQFKEDSVDQFVATIKEINDEPKKEFQLGAVPFGIMMWLLGAITGCVIGMLIAWRM
jgi:hypothetical protein